jgi:nitrite reductase (NO-forming)
MIGTGSDRRTERVPLVQAQTRQTVRLSMALAGLAATVALAGEARWVPLHLFLAGAVVLAISGASQLLTVTWSAAPAPPDRWAATQRWTVAVGAVGVVAARRLDAPDATLGLAGAVYLLGLVLLGVLLAATAARGRKRRFDPAVAAYLGAVAFGVVGVGLGVRMAIDPSEAALRSAHLVANLLGMVGLVVGGTLPYFAATVGRSRMSVLATQRRLWFLAGWQVAMLTGATVALAVDALPAGAGAGALVGYATGIGAIVVLLPRPTRRQLQWAGPRLVALWVGAAWWAASVLVAAGAAARGDPVLSGRWLVVLAIAGYGQILWGSLAYLLPMLRGGGPELLAEGFAATRSWFGLAAIEGAGLAIVLDRPAVAGAALAAGTIDATWRGAQVGTRQATRPRPPRGGLS